MAGPHLSRIQRARQVADPQVAKLAEALAAMPAEARTALAEALQAGSE